MTRQFLYGAIAMYLIQSAICGLAMKATMPALNLIGATYIGLTWPVPMLCIGFHGQCSVIPPAKYAKWMFSFKKVSPQ